MTFTIDNTVPSLATNHHQAKLREALLPVGTHIVLMLTPGHDHVRDHNYKRGIIIARKGDMYRVILETRGRQEVRPCFWIPGVNLLARTDKVDKNFKNAKLYNGHDNARRDAPTRYSMVSGEWGHGK